MYKSFKVSNFRCFQELTLNDLERVNLITGLNNVGKTALLEAMFIHCGAYNPELTMRVNAFRGLETFKLELGQWVETPWDTIFNNFDISKTVEIEGKDEAGDQRLLRLRVVRQPAELGKIPQSIQHGPDRPVRVPISTETAQILELEYKQKNRKGKHYLIFDPSGLRTEPIPPSPPFPAFFLAARVRQPLEKDAERFGKLDIEGQQDTLLKALKVIEPRLRRLAIALPGGVPVIHGDIGLSKLVPLPVMGEGTARLASLVLAISNAPNGIVLVDEIENGLHYSILTRMWQAIGEAAKQFNTQVFSTTHSLECIVAAHKAFTESGHYDFRVHRLERVKETIQAVTYDQESLAATIETNLEVR